jgi:bromodomain-containing protein 7/9
LDQISKASSIVIAYETDWNIEIEQDDDHSINHDVTVEGDDLSGKGRSPSVQAPERERERGRRGLRGPYVKRAVLNNNANVADMIDGEGRLPGSKDGVGAFPPGSDWAELMVQLKLKGARFT